MKSRRHKRIWILLLILAAPGPGLAADWWDQASIMQRCEEWIALAPRQPRIAAEHLAALTNSPSAAQRRTRTVFVLLVQEKTFSAALLSMLRTRETPFLDKSLAVGGRIILEPVKGFLTDRTHTDAYVRSRCARIIGYTKLPEAWPLLLDELEKELDAPVQAAMVSALVALDQPDRKAWRRVLSLARDDGLKKTTRILLHDLLGRSSSMEVIEFLIREGRHQRDADLRVAALHALTIAAETTRRRYPGGVQALTLLKAADLLWENGENDARMPGAAAALIWSRLDHERFDEIFRGRRDKELFWLETSDDPGAIESWCQAASERHPFLRPNRIDVIRNLIEAGRHDAMDALRGPFLAAAMNKSFPEWAVVVGVDALALSGNDLKKAGKTVLRLAGGEPDRSACSRFQQLTWKMEVANCETAIQRAGSMGPAMAWAGNAIIAREKKIGGLRPYASARSGNLGDMIAADILTRGGEADLEHLARVGKPKFREKALARLTKTGNIRMALEWARVSPDAFLDHLARILRRGKPKHSADAAAIIRYLLMESDSTSARGHLTRLFPRGKANPADVKEAWRACLEAASNRETPLLTMLVNCLDQAPGARNRAVAGVLSKMNPGIQLTERIEDFQTRARK